MKDSEKKIQELEETIQNLRSDLSSEQSKNAYTYNRLFELQEAVSCITSAPVTDDGESLVIDTETTGLNAFENEILQISIINTKGDVLFDSYFAPVALNVGLKWEEAERINHISPEMVEHSPRLCSRISQINAITTKAKKIIGYNIDFDRQFLQANGIVFASNAEFVDVMVPFAEFFGEWNDYYRNYTWQKLGVAAAYCGYDWSSHENAHNSLGDCFATLHVYNKLKELGKL